jgi:hypothetical protein
MDRLLRVIEHRNSSFTSKESPDPIFDLKLYQKGFGQNPSLDNANRSRYKRMSFSEYSNKTQNNEQLFNNSKITFLKSEIKPHQIKIPSQQVTNMIREKIKQAKAHSKKDNNFTEDDNKEKKNSHSAYILARKRVFDKQSSIGANSIS